MGVFSYITDIEKSKDFVWTKGIQQECCSIPLRDWQSKNATVAGFRLYGDSASIKQIGLGTRFYTICSKCQKWYEYEVGIKKVTKT